MYASPDARPRCLVYLLDKYFEKFPTDSRVSDLFYLHPKASFTDESVWYECSPVGVNKLWIVCVKKLELLTKRQTTV